MVVTIMSLQDQLEQAHAKIAELEKPKEIDGQSGNS
jgi:hypothetical protein